MPVLLDHTIIGTAGHIDHGKTALIKALTGTDTDTLAEEKKRGITIELGFAFLDAPELAKQVIFIDVPGHEKLIKTMVAGASNIDAVLFVIAADEGIGVQTIEHLDILNLLGISDGIIALTKVDLVDDEHVRAVTEDIRSLVSDTFLAEAPIIPVSSVTRVGVAEVKSKLVETARKVKERADGGIFRMPIDRAFAMQGFGAVIAGTILSGKVNVGDKLEILPDGLMARVRGIQIRGESLQQSPIGTRTAVNLQDVKKEQLRRGQCACTPGMLKATTRVDTNFHLLKSYGEPLKNRTRIRLHVAADEVIGRVVLLDRDAMDPGQTAPVQFALESPTVTLPKDRFVIRTFSSVRTVGGGVILDAFATAHKKQDEDAIDALRVIPGSVSDAAEHAFRRSRKPLGLTDAAAITGEGEDEIVEAMEDLLSTERIVRISTADAVDFRKDLFLHTEIYGDLADQLTSAIAAYYRQNPYRQYMPASGLQSEFLRLADRSIYDAILRDLGGCGLLSVKRTKVGLADRIIEWKPGEEDLARQIEALFERAGYSTPPDEEVIESLKANPRAYANVMTALLDQGQLVRIHERVTYHARIFQSALGVVRSHIREHGSITAAELRDKLDVTRKYAVAILEYLDGAQVTKRIGDKRVLTEKYRPGAATEASK
jgi:selenocysteine-specific elongation factor